MVLTDEQEQKVHKNKLYHKTKGSLHVISIFMDCTVKKNKKNMVNLHGFKVPLTEEH